MRWGIGGALVRLPDRRQCVAVHPGLNVRVQPRNTAPGLQLWEVKPRKLVPSVVSFQLWTRENVHSYFERGNLVTPSRGHPQTSHAWFAPRSHIPLHRKDCRIPCVGYNGPKISCSLSAVQDAQVSDFTNGSDKTIYTLPIYVMDRFNHH